MGFPSGLAVKNLLAMQEIQETQVQSLGQEDPLEEEIPTHTSSLAKKIPWIEEPGGLQSMGVNKIVNGRVWKIKARKSFRKWKKKSMENNGEEKK